MSVPPVEAAKYELFQYNLYMIATVLEVVLGVILLLVCIAHQAFFGGMICLVVVLGCAGLTGMVAEECKHDYERIMESLALKTSED